MVFDKTAFGGALSAPSVTWIDGTDAFIVTTVKDAAGNPGGIWRVTLAPGGTGTVEDLTPTLPAWIEAPFDDADYAPGLDRLFLLQADQGWIASWARPAQDSLATLSPWGTLPPGDAVSIAVNGAKQPFGVVAVLVSGPVLRVDKAGTQELFAFGSWTDVAAHPVTGELIVARQISDMIGMLWGNVLESFNHSGFCGPLVMQPADVEWDAVAGRAVAIASVPLAGCTAAFAGAVGTNHVVRLPASTAGPSGCCEPVLLTPAGPSGITGKRADIALVRHGGSEVTYWGFPNAGAGSSQPTFEHQGPLALGQTVQLRLAEAPPAAAALLVIGLHPAPVVLQGQLIVPAPQALLPALTDANGEAQLALELPASATSLVGLEVYMQWIVDDSTTLAAGDIASSQAAVLTAGLN